MKKINWKKTGMAFISGCALGTALIPLRVGSALSPWIWPLSFGAAAGLTVYTVTEDKGAALLAGGAGMVVGTGTACIWPLISIPVLLTTPLMPPALGVLAAIGANCE